MRRYLYIAYGIATVAFIYGCWKGWFTENAIFVTTVIPVGFFVLLFATFLIRGVSGYQQKNASLRGSVINLIKALGCVAGSFAWLFFFTGLVPNNAHGATIVLVPCIGLLIIGLFYLLRTNLLGGITRFIFATFATPLSAVEVGTFRVSTSNTDGVIEIPINYVAIYLRYTAVLLPAFCLWWFLARDDASITMGLLLGSLFIIYSNMKTTAGRGPAVIISPSGLSVRRGSGLPYEIRWQNISTLALRSTRLGVSFLVVDIRNPQGLESGRSAYARWVLRQYERKYGSSVIISVSNLKCDRKWLLQTLTEYHDRYGFG